MAWDLFSLHFKQVFDGGYRYLDRCGDFMLAAEQDLGFLPDDIKPIGAKMSIPEEGISASLDARELSVSQELCTDDRKSFFSNCNHLAKLYRDLFTPRSVESNGVASKSMWQLDTAGEALKTSLKIGDVLHDELSKLIEMPALQNKLDFRFTAGSYDLRVLLQPVTFQNITLQKHNIGPRLTESQKRRIERLNKRSEKVNFSLAHALMLELDLIEYNPPQDSLQRHFEELEKKEDVLRKRFEVK
jgi:hypothetical protein